MWRRLSLPVLLFLLFFGQVTLAARQTSITLDESLHITSGYSCLVTGDYRLVEEHPPLLKMIQALPLLWAIPPPPDPREVPGWGEQDLIVAAQHVVVPYRPIERLVFAARVPTMLVGVLLAALVYRWAADAFGHPAALLALTLSVFDPNILAHSGVAATDLGAACGIFASTYAFWRWLRSPTGPLWPRALAAGAVLGLALGVKTTAALLLPLFAALLLLGRPAGRPLRFYLAQAIAGSIVAFLVLWAIYRFEIGSVHGWPFPIPAASHLLPFLKLSQHLRSGHAAFLMGQNYHFGVWYYFPIAFLLKTPPLTLALLILTSGMLILRRGPSAGWRGEVVLLAYPVVYFGLSLTSALNIGYRHLLPILPFLLVWVSRLGLLVQRVPWFGPRLALLIPLAGYALVALMLFPWYLAYFNFLAGGPDGGYRYLVDSNLDWGQTWKALRRYVEAHGINEFGLSQYTINDPRAYGLEYTPLPPWPDAPAVLPRRFDPPPGVYAISTSTLQGVVTADPEMFDYFRKIEPVARIGHAMFVYRVEPHPPADWVVQCTVPVVPLPADAVGAGFGRGDLRLAYFDCTQSWLFPPGNGWYVLMRPYQGWGTEFLQQMRAAYEQRRTGFTPPFIVYEWFGQHPLDGLVPGTARAAPGDWPPAQAQAEGVTVTTPVQVGDWLQFLGYRSDTVEVPAGGEAVVYTYWQVIGQPEQPLSLMGHVLAADGIPIAVSDGLGVPMDQWQPGDIIVQRHAFPVPQEAAAGQYWVQVGAYTLPDVHRFPVLREGTVVGDRLIVGLVEVTAR